MATKTNLGFVEYAKAQLGKPYWYGTYGQIATEALYKGKKKQYPQYYTATDFPSQYGQKVHDCSGLPEGYLMSESIDDVPKYNSKYDYSANGLRKACKEQGDIKTIPEIPGVCVFYDGHVGVYIGNGYVIEARGHKYGVVKTKLSARPWKWWGKHPDIEYVEDKPKEDEPKEETPDSAEKLVTVTVAQIRNGSRGEAVKTAQRLLRALGYDVGDAKTDGAFGKVTEAAVKKFQSDKKLTVDGIVGAKTWGALVNG